MIDTDPRDLQQKNLESYISATGFKGLFMSIFYRDSAIMTVINNPDHSEHKELRALLIDTIKGKSLEMRITQEAVAAKVDDIPPKAEHGFLPFAIKASAGMQQQIAAIKFLTQLAASDDEVYKTLWHAAKGENSQMGNVSDAAIKVLNQIVEYRKTDLKMVALNPLRKSEDRSLAYTILASHSLFTSAEIYELVCDLASDQSIVNLYEKRGILAPSAKFWFEADMNLRKQYPEQHRDGKTEEEVKASVVQKVQKELQRKILDVVEQAIKDGHLYNDIQDANFLRESYPQTTQRLTRELCRLVVEDPNYQLIGLCKYAKLNLSTVEAEHIIETLKRARKGTWNLVHEKSWIDSTINDVRFSLSKSRADGYGRYLDRDYLTQIWEGRTTAQQILEQRRRYSGVL